MKYTDGHAATISPLCVYFLLFLQIMHADTAPGYNICIEDRTEWKAERNYMTSEFWNNESWPEKDTHERARARTHTHTHTHTHTQFRKEMRSAGRTLIGEGPLEKRCRYEVYNRVPYRLSRKIPAQNLTQVRAQKNNLRIYEDNKRHGYIFSFFLCLRCPV
jgi:hypothetical protein